MRLRVAIGLTFILIGLVVLGYNQIMQQSYSFEERSSEIENFNQMSAGETPIPPGSFVRYWQDDEAWKNVAYFEGTISDSGSGLCIAASIASDISQEYLTPVDLITLMENDYQIIDYSSEIEMLTGYLSNTYARSFSEKYLDKDRALQELSEGKCLICCATGQVGDQDYSNQTILLFGLEEDRLNLYNPKYSLVPVLTLDNFETLTFEYFISMNRG